MEWQKEDASPYYKGEAGTFCLQDAKHDIVIGNINDERPPEDRVRNSISTKRKTMKLKIDSEKSLKATREQRIKLQDASLNYKREAEASCLQDTKSDLAIANINGVKSPDDPDGNWTSSEILEIENYDSINDMKKTEKWEIDKGNLLLADNTIGMAPYAKVEIDTPYYKGKV